MASAPGAAGAAAGVGRHRARLQQVPVPARHAAERRRARRVPPRVRRHGELEEREQAHVQLTTHVATDGTSQRLKPINMVGSNSHTLSTCRGQIVPNSRRCARH